MSVFIIGAGVAGLTTGLKLQESGINCTIIEKENEIGGLARSFKWGGINFDLGPHFIFQDSNPTAVEFIKNILWQKYYTLNYKIGIYFSDKYFSWPPKILKMLYSFPPEVALHHLLRPFKREGLLDESFKSYITIKHGEHLYNKFFSPYIEKKTGLSGADLHIEWWLRPFRSFENGTWDHEALSVRPKTGRFAELRMLLGKVFSSGSKVFYPHGGMGTFPNMLAEKFSNMGGVIKTGIKDFRLVMSGNYVSEVELDGEIAYKVKELIWTAPMDLLARTLKIPEPKLFYLPVILCFARLNKKASSGKYLYVYYGDREIIFNRAYFPSNISADFVPPNKDAICVEITPGNDDMFNDKNKLRQRVSNDLEKVGICLARSIEDMEIIRMEKSYPLYVMPYKKELSHFMSRLKEYKNIWIAGRTGLFYNVLTDGAVKSALDLAKGILEVYRKEDV